VPRLVKKRKREKEKSRTFIQIHSMTTAFCVTAERKGRTGYFEGKVYASDINRKKAAISFEGICVAMSMYIYIYLARTVHMCAHAHVPSLPTWQATFE